MAFMPDDEAPQTLTIVVAPVLQPLMFGRRRSSRVTVRDDGASTIGHLIGSLGIPLTEVGDIMVGDTIVDPTWRPTPNSTVSLTPRHRPQAAPTDPPRFLLDVHLGTLARRLRLLGIDAAWSNDATDDELVAQASATRRVILTRDHGLLLRRTVRDGAYVRGNQPADQLVDVVNRFAPPLAPWTRCPACNTVVVPAAKSAILSRIQPGTQRNYDAFARCPGCERVFWQGAHYDHLQRIVAQARAAI